LSKELEEHKTINNKDGILDRVSTLCRLWYNAYAWERKIQNATSTRGRTILHQKAHFLSASQARPMPTMDVVGGGLRSVTHDETRVKSSCFQTDFGLRDKRKMIGERMFWPVQHPNGTEVVLVWVQL